MPHLVVDVSGHGFGHMAQVLPVLNALSAGSPGLRITVRTRVPESVWRPRLVPPCRTAPPPPEPDLAMGSAVDVAVATSLAAYGALHADWRGAVVAAARALRDLDPDLLLADVGYLSLAAAAQARIPAVALSSLNWADVLDAYADAPPIVAQMRAAYATARAFLRVTPAMPMAWLNAAIAVGPVALLGTDRSTALRARLGLHAGTRLALVGLGGIPTRLAFERWPQLPGWHWLVPDQHHCRRADATALGSLDIQFSDALASADLLITKPGYGTFVEAACLGKAVIYAQRPDWPEEPGLSDWLHVSTRAAGIDRESLFAGELAELPDRLLATPAPPRPLPSGNQEAARYLADLLAELT